MFPAVVRLDQKCKKPWPVRSRGREELTQSLTSKALVSNSFLLLLAWHLFLVAWHLFLVASMKHKNLKKRTSMQALKCCTSAKAAFEECFGPSAAPAQNCNKKTKRTATVSQSTTSNKDATRGRPSLLGWTTASNKDPIGWRPPQVLSKLQKLQHIVSAQGLSAPMPQQSQPIRSLAPPL